MRCSTRSHSLNALVPARGPRRIPALVLCSLLAVTTAACSDDADPAEPDASAPTSTARIYATVAADHEVLVIDDASHEVLSQIPVGKGPAILLATPDQKKLYTANWADETISAIAVESEQVTSIDVTGRPYVIALSPDGKWLYAGLASNAIVVIDTATDAIERTLPTPDLPASVIVSADGDTLYVATLGGTIRALDAQTGDVVHGPIAVGAVPAWITITPDGSKVFTLNFLSDDISVVDTAAWKVVETIETGAGTQGIIGGVTPDGSLLHVTNHGTGDLIAIDTESYEITQTIELDGRPVGVTVNADATQVYVADFGTESLAQPLDMAYLLTGRFTGTNDGQISVFDTSTGKRVGKKLSVGPGPTSLVVLE